MIIKNVGNLDRVLRVVSGLALALGAFLADGPAVYILGGAAAGAVITGLLGWCGLYTLMGINTCKIDKP